MELVLWRIAKYLSLAWFAVGLVGAIRPTDAEQRQRAVVRVCVPGFGAACIASYGLMKALGLGLGEPWVFRGFLAAAAAVCGAVMAAEGRRTRRLGAAAALAGFGAATALMVTRHLLDPTVPVALTTALCAAAGALLAPLETTEPSGQRALAWFRTIAWLEGASLILLVGIAMPLKRLAGIHLDGGQGWIGWAHGVLVVLYLPALASAAWAGPLSLPRVLLGFLASIVPGGTFAFERWGLPDRAASTVDPEAPAR